MDERSTSRDRPGDVEKYLTFCLADEHFGLEILSVREIIGMMDVTGVPGTPGYVEGVINLRGSVIPVIDLRSKLNMPPTERNSDTCIIVVNVQDAEIGIIVDRVLEVLNVLKDDIQESPEFGAVDTQFILGMARTNDRVTILLDVTRVLRGMDVKQLETLTETAAA